MGRVRLRRTVERGLCDHDQPYICVASDDGGLLPRLFRGALGNEGVCSVGFWEGTLVLFLGRWYREWEEKAPWHMEFGLGSLHVESSNGPKFMYLCSVLCLIYYIGSLCSSCFADATAGMCWFGVWWGHDTDVRGRDVHGWVRQIDVSPSTCRWSVEVYVSQGPHQGATVVFGYIEGSFLVRKTGDVYERYDFNIYKCIHT